MDETGTTGAVLVADDDPAIRATLVGLLSDEGYRVVEAADAAAVLAQVNGSEPPALVLLDVRMPGAKDLDLLRQLLDRKDPPGVIMMTAFSTANLAIRAIQAGAYDYIAKPFHLDEVALTAARFFEHRDLERQVETLQAGRLQGRDPAERLIGDSPAMRRVYTTIGRLAGSEATVLITGETGTGKELVARTLHTNSTFARGPFVAVHCAALPETLLESELFGHEKGAFTGAIDQKKGRFERANKGTLFLDEIGEIGPAIQKKLLRVLQEREIERVGGTQPIKVDVRVIAATNKMLEAEVAAGRFREDLFYRLNVLTIHLPPLRDRLEDLPLLAEYFLDKHRYTPGGPPARLSAPALERLMAHTWPGNVREMENTLERAVALAQGGIITANHIRFPAVHERPFIDVAERVRARTPLATLMADVARLALAEALRQADGDQAAAAATLGLAPIEFRDQAERVNLALSEPLGLPN
jgi:two-component system response regulator AtoC